MAGHSSLTSSDTSTSTNGARADINRVSKPRLQVNRRERRVRAESRLVIEGSLRARAAACLVPREEERASTFVLVRRGLQLVLLGEQELQRAVRVGALGGDVEAEDGGDVVGREDAVVAGAEGLLGLLRGDLGDVVREFELAWCKIRWAPGLLVVTPFVVFEFPLGNQLIWGSDDCAEQERYENSVPHVGLC